jgi:hypothetical protein
MSEQRKVLCDQCDADITFTENAVDYSIRMVNRSIPSNCSVVSLAMRYPHLEESLDFCNRECLKKYVKDNF